MSFTLPQLIVKTSHYFHNLVTYCFDIFSSYSAHSTPMYLLCPRVAQYSTSDIFRRGWEFIESDTVLLYVRYKFLFHHHYLSVYGTRLTALGIR
jgi:hypothetical protein